MPRKRGTYLQDDGYTIKTDRETGKELHGSTRQCIHCGGHFEYIPGKIRGYCQNCDGWLCGQGPCQTCVHVEQRLENWEAGRDEFFKPTQILVPALPAMSYAKKIIVPGE